MVSDKTSIINTQVYGMLSKKQTMVENSAKMAELSHNAQVHPVRELLSGSVVDRLQR